MIHVWFFLPNDDMIKDVHVATFQKICSNSDQSLNLSTMYVWPSFHIPPEVHFTKLIFRCFLTTNHKNGPFPLSYEVKKIHFTTPNVGYERVFIIYEGFSALTTVFELC